MRLPAPAHLRVGTDIMQRSRLQKSFLNEPIRLMRLTRRLLHANELAMLSRRFPGWQNTDGQPLMTRDGIASWLAGRWAAKEAAKKAWGPRLLSFRDLRVEVTESGEIEIVCSPHSASEALPGRNVLEQAARLSISHDGEYAIAIVLASPLHPDIETELNRQARIAERKTK